MINDALAGRLFNCGKESGRKDSLDAAAIYGQNASQVAALMA